MADLLEKLKYVQQNLKAPKNQTNKFGGYNYRSCEDIFEAVKPLLEEQKLALTLEDELIQVGERYYVKATARLYDVEQPLIHFDDDCDGLNEIINTAYAREEETKKGMDGSQITGASSSYARKYALNGLFLIDDVKDSDTTNQGEDPTDEDAKNWTFQFGKYKGSTMDEIINEDVQYVEWFINNKGNNFDKRCYEILTGVKLPTDEELKHRCDLLLKYKKLLADTKTDEFKLKEHYGVELVDEMTDEQLEDAINVMEQKK